MFSSSQNHSTSAMTSYAYDAKSISTTTPPEYINLLHSNGKLLSNYQLESFKTRSSLWGLGYYTPEKARLPHGILKTANDIFARIETPIGAGNFGQVYDCQSMNTGNWDVVKAIYNQKFPSITYEIATEEHKALVAARKSQKSFIVQSTIPGTAQIMYHVIMEKEQGVPLIQLFKNGEIKSYPLLKRIYFALLSFYAIDKNFHQKDLIHCDLKLENILISVLGANIIDYASVHDPKTVFKKKAILSTLDYQAPELCKKNRSPYSKATDVYSAGIILAELLAQETCYMKSGKKIYPQLPAEIYTYSGLIDLVIAMTARDPKDRPTMARAYQRLYDFYRKDEFKQERLAIKKERDTLLKEKQLAAEKINRMFLKKQKEKHSLTEQQITETMDAYQKRSLPLRCIKIEPSSETQKMMLALGMDLPISSKKDSSHPKTQRKEGSELYEIAKKYVLENPQKRFAHMLYKNVFKGKDLEVQQTYEVLDREKSFLRKIIG